MDFFKAAEKNKIQDNSNVLLSAYLVQSGVAKMLAGALPLSLSLAYIHFVQVAANEMGMHIKSKEIQPVK